MAYCPVYGRSAIVCSRCCYRRGGITSVLDSKPAQEVAQRLGVAWPPANGFFTFKLPSNAPGQASVLLLTDTEVIFGQHRLPLWSSRTYMHGGYLVIEGIDQDIVLAVPAKDNPASIVAKLKSLERAMPEYKDVEAKRAARRQKREALIRAEAAKAAAPPSSGKGGSVDKRPKASIGIQFVRAVLIVWLVAVIVLFASGHSTLGIVVIAASVGVMIGVAKIMAAEENKISKVGVQGANGLQCPKCGGTNFKAKRSAGGKMGLGLLAPKTRVRCVTCGAQYTRG